MGNTVKPKSGVPQPAGSIGGLGVGTAGLNETGRKESPDIWSDCPWDDIIDPRSETYGVTFYDHFGNLPLQPTETTQVSYLNYKAFATASGAVVPVMTMNSVVQPGGILNLAPDADNHAASIAQAFQDFSLSGNTAVDGKLWFECCFAVSSIVASHISFLVGLAETSLWTLATGVPYSSDTGAAITNGASFLGFKRIATATSTIDTAYSDRATTFTAIGAADVTGVAAFTFFKLGFVYNPADTVNTIRFYQNSVQTATVVPIATITGTTNLKANPLGLIFASQGGSAASSDGIFIDWWRIAQILPY